MLKDFVNYRNRGRDRIGLGSGLFSFFFLSFICLYQALVVAGRSFRLSCAYRGLQLWHVGSSSPSRDGPQAPCVGTVKS